MLERIIKEIEKATASYKRELPPNTYDDYALARMDWNYQLLFGIAHSHPLEHSASLHISDLERKLPVFHYPGLKNPIFLQFDFEDNSDLKETLVALSEKYDAKLPVLRMMNGIEATPDKPVFIVVTILLFPIVMQDEN